MENNSPFVTWFYNIAWQLESHVLGDLPHMIYELACIELDDSFDDRWFIDYITYYQQKDGSVNSLVVHKDHLTRHD